MNRDYETLQAPPSGLCACSLNGIYQHIAAISPRSVTLRLPEAGLAAGALRLRLYQAEAGKYESFHIQQYHAGEAQLQNDAVLLRLCFDDPACARAIRCMLSGYARYLRVKSELGAAAWAWEVSAYPAERDEDFLPSLQAQQRAWFESAPPLPPPPAGTSLAVALNCPELWRLYLSLPPRDFLQAYCRCRCLPPDLLPRMPDRLYIGSGHCRFLFPEEDELRALAGKARAEGLALTLSTAELRPGGEAAADRLIGLAGELHAELEINDWGMLRRAAGRVPLLLGPRLNRRRKDPRLPYKQDAQSELLAQNSLNDPAWQTFLRQKGVVRCEYESCGLPTLLPELPCSLHLPFYQTNASLWCPLQALCLRGDRGAQQPSDACAGWCDGNVLLYPAHLRMVGRWNALLALADFPAPEELQRYDRWVLNF